MTVVRHTENSAIIDVGNYRIEPGPPRIREVATEELLSDDLTAPHYHAPRKEIVEDSYGRREVEVMARDADGNVIKVGAEFTYLDWGGNKREGKRIFYIYKKVPVNSLDEFLDGEPNPHYVPKHVRDAAEAGEHGDNRVAYDYKWEEVSTAETEEEAVEFCEDAE